MKGRTAAGDADPTEEVGKASSVGQATCGAETQATSPADTSAAKEAAGEKARDEVPKFEGPTAVEPGLGESSSRDQEGDGRERVDSGRSQCIDPSATAGSTSPTQPPHRIKFAEEEAGCDASNTSAAGQVEFAAEKSQESNSMGRPSATELCPGEGALSYSENPASPSEDGALRAAGAEDHRDQAVQGSSDAEAADAERATDEVPKSDRPTAEELGLDDDSRSYSQDPASPSEDGALRAAGAEDHRDQAVQGSSDAEAADAERATDEVPKLDRPTAEELGLDDDSRSYSQDPGSPSEDGAFSRAAGAEDHRDQAVQGSSDVEAADAERATDEVPKSDRPTAEELGLDDDSRSYSEDPASPSEDGALRAAGAEDHRDQAAQGSSDAEAADAERATDEVPKSDRPTAEELGLDDDSRSYSQDPGSPSEDGAFSRAAGAEDHRDQAGQGSSDAEAADAERVTDEVPKSDRPTAEELGLDDDSRSYSEVPASASEDGAFSRTSGADDHPDQAVQVQGAAVAKEVAAAHIATDDEPKSDQPIAEQLGVDDSPRDSRTLLTFAVDLQEPASSPESNFLPDPTLSEVRPDEADS